MKKVFVLVGFLFAGSALFAQIHVSFDGHLATNFSNVAPTLGIEINFNKVDILAGTSFWFYESERTIKDYSYYNTDSKTIQNRYEFFAGIAPKAITTDKWSLTFPLLAKISFRNDELKYVDGNVYTNDSPKNAEYFGYGFDIGSRVYYTIGRKWNIYAGFLFELFSKTNNKYTYWKNSPNITYTQEYNTMVWFDNGEFGLGVRCTF